MADEGGCLYDERGASTSTSPCRSMPDEALRTPPRGTTARSPEQRPQFVLGRFQMHALMRGKILPAAVDIEVQHRHGRTKRRQLAPLAVLGGSLQRLCDFLRVALAEHARFQIERVTGFGDPLRPAALAVRGSVRMRGGGHRRAPDDRGDASSNAGMVTAMYAWTDAGVMGTTGAIAATLPRGQVLIESPVAVIARHGDSAGSTVSR